MSVRTLPTAKGRSLPRVVAASCVAAAIAATINTLLAVTAVAAFGVPAKFEPLAIPAVATASAVGALGAGACWAVLNRVVPRPVPVFLAAAALGLVASMYPPIDLAIADPPPYPGVSAGAVATLMLMHVVVAVTSAAVLVRGLPARLFRQGAR